MPVNGRPDYRNLAELIAQRQLTKQPVPGKPMATSEITDRIRKIVALHLGTEHYEAMLSVETAADLIGDIGTWLDEPLSDGSLIPTFMLSRFVRHHVTVALGGNRRPPPVGKLQFAQKQF